MKPITYQEAGVDIEAGERLVARIRTWARHTFRTGVLGDIGGFGGLFRIAELGYRDPVLVSSIDGVGTKLKIAIAAARHDTIGRDLVNHCVNDIAVCGAEPLFFLDYFATGKLEPEVAEHVIKGIAEACRENGCALIGGETAEMPDLYAPGDYDLAGAIVGIVERERILDGSAIQAGDVLIGLPSTGLHTNGYSLARRVLLAHYRLESYVEELGATLAEALLAVHRSYLGLIRGLRQAVPVRAFSHITGGGIEGNTRRLLAPNLGLRIDWNAWPRPALFTLMQRLGPVSEEEMRRVFNLGIGLVAVVPPEHAQQALLWLDQVGEQAWVIGEVIPR
ncbi:MAG: phosphoribosylformylglycinamidine cyclo-ligase [Bacteroidetes bacterium]|nr:phosphoribosylformylglycinamidine cyclo-ligase [Rhodothermia bacterium]MCS7155350.1 phosphoribosylformylglycinamidine cyclo-ligase [Bacteroidota bacterium]MCX7907557.1 phosphoribosylformylglycinamidine cyclo-ligase [Bacteroidota bacterium]MDW8138551.1 phosphoribosylformylglycinamidine cyclo-ligase [Bacteroidota bacterium]MDW8284512.1 phosphoribosylformylglycinamidine cyclo-ligase [Bacteroidota bacterium]